MIPIRALRPGAGSKYRPRASDTMTEPEYLRSSMGEDIWQAGMHPDLPSDDKVLDNPYTYTEFRTAATREARESIFGEAASS